MSKKRKISSSENDEEEEEETPVESKEKVVNTFETKKKPTAGVIYLSRIPNKMNVTIIRSYFDQYGQTGRIYLQLSSKFFIFFSYLSIDFFFILLKKMKTNINVNVVQNILKVGLNLNLNVMQNLLLNNLIINKLVDDDEHHGMMIFGILSK
jgi:hypothetical protein